MKRLLLLPFLCLMPAAEAVDFVKCESIQAAASRVKESMDWRPAYKAELRAKQEAACGTYNQWQFNFSSRQEFQKCQRKNKIFKTEAIKQAWIDAYQAPIKARLETIQAAYDAEGCY